MDLFDTIRIQSCMLSLCLKMCDKRDWHVYFDLFNRQNDAVFLKSRQVIGKV